jgi:YidC/Oxa1 family membrane protein insertase
MWDLIFNPLVTLMMWLYSILGNNIVLGIVVLTILIRMVTYPLTIQQMRSSKKMQELQPQLKKIQEKYKDDREKLSQAQMQLYREAGVNPVGGCLPLLIQYPILIAMYQAIFFALANTPYQLVELSQRLLIPDLARLMPLNNIWLGMDLTRTPVPPQNPIYALVLPLLVMATTYYQFKMTMPAQTAPADPNDQAAAMTRSLSTTMPLVFGFLSLTFNVGLSIYFIVSNVIGILQYTPQFRNFMDKIFPEKPAKSKVESSLPESISTKKAVETVTGGSNGKSSSSTAKKTTKSTGKSYSQKK